MGPPTQSVCGLRTIRSGVFSNYIHPVIIRAAIIMVPNVLTHFR